MSSRSPAPVSPFESFSSWLLEWATGTSRQSVRRAPISHCIVLGGRVFDSEASASSPPILIFIRKREAEECPLCVTNRSSTLAWIKFHLKWSIIISNGGAREGPWVRVVRDDRRNAATLLTGPLSKLCPSSRWASGLPPTTLFGSREVHLSS